jgi:hypothetical protein
MQKSRRRDVQVDDSLGESAKSVLAACMHVASNDFGDGDGSERWAQKFTKLFLFISAGLGVVVVAVCGGLSLMHNCCWHLAACCSMDAEPSALDSKKRFTSMSMSQY